MYCVCLVFAYPDTQERDWKCCLFFNLKPFTREENYYYLLIYNRQTVKFIKYPIFDFTALGISKDRNSLLWRVHHLFCCTHVILQKPVVEQRSIMNILQPTKSLLNVPKQNTTNFLAKRKQSTYGIL